MRITKEQARILSEMTAKRMLWFQRVIERLTKLGYTPEDKLLNAAIQAHEGAHTLKIVAYYESCEDGIR